MQKINFYNENGNKVQAEFVFSIIIPSINKTFVAINNGDLVFNEESSYNNLDILELISENGKNYYVSDVKDEDWETVKQAIIEEFLSKIK